MTTIVYTGTREPEAVSGHTIVHLPMLEALPLPLPDDLGGGIAGATHLVFYSVHAAEIILQTFAASLSHATIWAVGQRTSDCLARGVDGVINVPTRENFLGLLDELRPTIGPHDRIVSFEAEGTEHRLAAQSLEVPVRSVATYRTVATHWDDLDSLLRRVAPTWVIFSSPRGFATFCDNLHHRIIGDAYRIAAIGPTTASAIEAAGARVDFVARSPDLAALVDALA